MKRLILLLVLLLALLPATPALAAVEPNPTNAIVWAINAWDGRVYQTTWAPPSSKQLYLMAGQPATLRLTSTEIYYWPLDRAYRANWLLRDETVAGTLEVWQGPRLVQTLEPEPFVIQSPSGDLNNETLLYHGAAATDRFNAYLGELNRYSEALRAHDEALSKLTPNQQPPAQPAPPLTASTNPATGYTIDLPVGDYVLKVKAPNGGYIADAERDLTLFGARREGTGYQVLPEERWTEPEIAASPADVIYATGGATLYLVPFHASELPDQAYTRMLNPQSPAGQSGKWRWVLTKPIANPPPVLTAEGHALTALPYQVEQLPGATLGYRVLQAPSPAEAHFVGYRVHLPAEFGQLSLTLPSDPTATREIHQVRSEPFPWLVDGAVLALCLGAAAFTLYRRLRSLD